jgi:hypothetical protein
LFFISLSNIATDRSANAPRAHFALSYFDALCVIDEMSISSPLVGKRSSSFDLVEVLLGRENWAWSDYVAAGGREFDRLHIATDRPSPFAPGDRDAYAVKYAELACPHWKRLVALASARAR